MILIMLVLVNIHSRIIHVFKYFGNTAAEQGSVILRDATRLFSK